MGDLDQQHEVHSVTKELLDELLEKLDKATICGPVIVGNAAKQELIKIGFAEDDFIPFTLEDY
jgi:NAD(P)H-flavin reductase